MSCPTYKQLCDRLIISQSVTFTNGNLIINIPQNNYRNNEKYCIVVAQTIPSTTTINAPVLITIGSDTTTTYPLINCNCTPVLACSINTRTRYSTCVRTSINSGVFQIIKKLPCSQCRVSPSSLPIAETTTPPANEAVLQQNNFISGDENAQNIRRS